MSASDLSLSFCVLQVETVFYRLQDTRGSLWIGAEIVQGTDQGLPGYQQLQLVSTEDQQTWTIVERARLAYCQPEEKKNRRCLELKDPARLPHPGEKLMLVPKPQKQFAFPWQEVADVHLHQWQRAFGWFPTAFHPTSPCPVCGQRTLFQWYLLHQQDPFVTDERLMLGRGSQWQWCGSCFCYLHCQAMVPYGWVSPFRTQPRELWTAPETLEQQRRSRLK